MYKVYSKRIKVLSSCKANRSIPVQFLCFAGIGAVGTSAHYTVLIMMVQILGVKPILSSIAGFVLGALVNYSLNYHFTFRSDRRHHEAIIRFFTIALVGLVLNTNIIALGIEIFKLHYFLSQIIATGIVLIWNFAGNRIWTFREAKHASRG